MSFQLRPPDRIEPGFVQLPIVTAQDALRYAQAHLIIVTQTSCIEPVSDHRVRLVEALLIAHNCAIAVSRQETKGISNECLSFRG